LKGDEHLLILFLDHMVCDGFSAAIVLRDVESTIRNLTFLQTSPVPLAGSFMDFCVWQHGAMRSSYFDRSLLYWRDQWAQYSSARIAAHDLPFSVFSEVRNPFVFSTIHGRFVDGTAQQIRSFARHSKSTLFTVFLTALAVVLSAYTRKTAVAIWSHFANRAQPGTSSMVGWLNNTHILGIDLSGNPSGWELLERVRGVTYAAIANQELPLPYLWCRLGCVPRLPDVAILIDYRTSKAITCFEGGQLEISRAVLPDSNGGRFSSLGFYLSDDGDLELTSKYCSERFNFEGVEKFLIDIKQVAADLSRNPYVDVAQYGNKLDLPSRKTEESGMGEFLLTRQELISTLPVI
jgi:hypothetical protein